MKTQLNVTGHRRGDTTYLTVVGDHQHGKTELALQHAFHEASEGRAVAFQGESRRTVRDVFLRAEQIAESIADVTKIVRRNGNESIKFANGGVIWFVLSIWGLADVDTHIIDGGVGEPHPSARHVIRTALR